MPPRSQAAKHERLRLYVLKAEEADEKAAKAEDVNIREIWRQIALARRALVKRVSDDLDNGKD